MKTLKQCLLVMACCITCLTFSQSKKDSIKKEIYKSGFKEYYPIHVKPSIGYMSSMYSSESILFDAKPTVYYSILNTMLYKMQEESHKPSYALYFTFQPHIRMYNEESKPVKMPSYKILFGGQVLTKTPNDNFFAIALETGHYSNGQSGCAFGEDLVDGSAECLIVHQSINDQSDLSELLNRTNGNFSTNLTKLSSSFRFNWFRSDNAPVKAIEFSAYWDWYHNYLLGLIDIGGYTDFDINIYGRHRFGVGAEFMHNFRDKFRYTLSVKSEVIPNAHPFVDPWRFEFNWTIYPFNRDLGFFVAFISGHDNYNYRFVDSGNQINLGITWDWFAPFEIKRAEIIKQKNLEE